MKEQRDEDLEELEEEELAEEDSPLNPWVMAAIFAGLVVLAAIICALLWHFTHLKGDDIAERNSASAAQSDFTASISPVPATSATPPSTPTVSPAATVTPTASPTPTATAAPTPTATPTPAVTPTPAASTAPTPSATPAIQTDPPIQDPVSGTTAMAFTSISDSVTPKDVINLRSEPNTLETDNIVAQARNGDILERTGINEDTGWTRIDYNGQTVYAVTQYLTTDLSYKTPVQAGNPNRVNTMDGRVILFTDLDDNITPKEYVNLRTEPSTSEGDSTVRCQVSNGEVLHRTGYSPDAGWSRVEYNGEILYVVSSYVYTVE